MFLHKKREKESRSGRGAKAKASNHPLFRELAKKNVKKAQGII